MSDSRGAFNPGMSFAGAVDLEALKHRASAAEGEAGGAPAAGAYVVDVDESGFDSMVRNSTTFPILLLLWAKDDTRYFDLARSLGETVNALQGKLQLVRMDIATNPQVVQALRVQGAPAIFGLVAGRPMPILQGMPTDEELSTIKDSLIPQIIALAEQQGITGSAPFMGDTNADGNGESDEADATHNEPIIPAEHETAYQLALDGDYAGAAEEYARIMEHDPHDAIAARERSKALLLARNGSSDVRVVRAAAADNPDDIDAQLNVADIDMIGGQIDDAFGRLLDFLATHRDVTDQVRERLLEYFTIPEATDPRVKRARQRLATLMY